MLTILILAAISSIVFSVAAIILNEIRVSGDISKSEPVINAAEGIAEDQLFKAMRGLGSLSLCNSPTSQILNSVTIKSCAGYYLPNPYGFTLVESGRRDFYLYNPVVVGGDPGYTNVSVQLLSGATSTIYFCTFDIPDCVANPNIDSKTLTSGGTTLWSAPALDATKAYQLVIINGSGTPSTYAVTGTPNGLPAGQTTIQNSASNGGVTRKLEITVPQ